MPTLIDDINDPLDPVSQFGCGNNVSYIILSCGFMLLYGVVDGENFENVFYLPDAQIQNLRIYGRKMLATDVTGQLYECDLELRRKLAPVNPSKYDQDFAVRKVFLGKSMRILLDSTLSPELCRVVAPVATMETLMESRVTIQLYDVLGDRYVLTDQGGMSVMEQLRGGLVKVLFTENESPLPK